MKIGFRKIATTQAMQFYSVDSYPINVRIKILKQKSHKKEEIFTKCSISLSVRDDLSADFKLAVSFPNLLIVLMTETHFACTDL